ncbi:MAG: hypothetical protein ACWGMZ_00510, partial [Thermoguttaceae bacterium]
CGRFAKRNKVRTSFHPDQFVVLNSPRPDVVAKSLEEMEYQSEVAEWVGADVVEFIPSPNPPGCDPTAARLAQKVLAWRHLAQR